MTEKKDDGSGETRLEGGEEARSPEAGGRVVSFSSHMTPSAKFELMDPAQRTSQEVEPLSQEELQRGTKGGIILMRIMTMSLEERKAQVVTQVADPLLMWFSFLTPEERRQFLKAAEASLTKLME